jgi:hypothetical protein
MTTEPLRRAWLSLACATFLAGACGGHAPGPYATGGGGNSTAATTAVVAMPTVGASCTDSWGDRPGTYPNGSSWYCGRDNGCTCTCNQGQIGTFGCGGVVTTSRVSSSSTTSCSSPPCALDAGALTGDAGATDAQDGADADAGYGACFSTAGLLLPALKACTSDGDCTFFGHIADCCGSVEQVGVELSQAERAVACEGRWVPSLPACGCSSNSVTTEDGRSDADGAAPEVHCVTGDAGSFCETSMP